MDFSPSLPGNHLIRIILTGAWFAFLPALFCNLLPGLALGAPLASLPVTFSLGIVLALLLIALPPGYSRIDRERLFSATIAHSLLVVVLLGLYFLLVPGMQVLFAGTLTDPKVPLFLFLLAALLLIRPLLAGISAEVNRRLLPERLDYQSLLCEISSSITTSLHLPDLLRVLTADLPERLKITGAGIILLEEQGEKIYPEDLCFAPRSWSESRVIELLRAGHHFFHCGPVSDDPQLSGELLAMRRAGFSLVYSLPGGSWNGGMLLLGPRKDGAGFRGPDLQIFSTLANQVNIAVENALNFETLSASKEQLQRVYDKLVQAEKMAALGELTTVLAHELKNPLGIIRGSAQYLADSPRDPSIQEELLNYIIDEVDTLNLVISNLLGLARHQPPHFRTIDLRRELSTFVCQWQQSSEHNPAVVILLTLPSYLPDLQADWKQLRQVLLNCLANSEEVMPQGGTIKIAVRSCDEDQLEIVLSDTGPGIAEENLKLIFKKFFTTKEKGVGLGLSVCRQIIRAHNGSIRLLNRAEGGVKVVIRLPLAPLAALGRTGNFAGKTNNTIVRKVWSNEY